MLGAQGLGTKGQLSRSNFFNSIMITTLCFKVQKRVSSHTATVYELEVFHRCRARLAAVMTLVPGSML